MLRSMNAPATDGKPDRFDAALAFVLRHEGGLVDHPADPGGLTNFGISQRSYPELDIRGLTRADATAIYRRDFWRPLRCAELPEPLDIVLFDTAVNCGPARAVRWLQSACGARPDGVLGSWTLSLARLHPARHAETVLRRRLAHCRALPTWPQFGRGWTNRIRDLARAAGLPDPT